MRGNWRMAEPSAVRAELADLGVPTADCERPVVPMSGCLHAVTLAFRAGQNNIAITLQGNDHSAGCFREPRASVASRRRQWVGISVYFEVLGRRGGR